MSTPTSTDNNTTNQKSNDQCLLQSERSRKRRHQSGEEENIDSAKINSSDEARDIFFKERNICKKREIKEVTKEEIVEDIMKDVRSTNHETKGCCMFQ